MTKGENRKRIRFRASAGLSAKRNRICWGKLLLMLISSEAKGIHCLDKTVRMKACPQGFLNTQEQLIWAKLEVGKWAKVTKFHPEAALSPRRPDPLCQLSWERSLVLHSHWTRCLVGVGRVPCAGRTTWILLPDVLLLPCSERILFLLRYVFRRPFQKKPGFWNLDRSGFKSRLYKWFTVLLEFNFLVNKV